MPKTASPSKPRSKTKSPRVPAPAGAPATPEVYWSHEHPKNGAVARVWTGDCREMLPRIPEVREGKVDLVFADPPFNWNRAYDQWDDAMPDEEYLRFMFDAGSGARPAGWIHQCVSALSPTGSLWINIPDTWAAEIVCYLKGGFREWKPPHPMHMVNWCVWHYRFGQNTTERFINSKVHALYFCRNPRRRTWNAKDVLEASDRASTYFDPRTMSKRDGMPAGQRVPLDVWYGPYWGRIQGNNKERRAYHDNQLPEAYLARVVLSTSNEGELVLDPFLGSGTTGVIAHDLGRHFIGTEFSRENAKLACERIERGPVRDPRAIQGASTAIHPPRRASARARAFTAPK